MKTTERLIARRKIIAAANAGRPAKKKLRARHIQLAVCIARRRGLVTPKVLIAAGFNPPKGQR